MGPDAAGWSDAESALLAAVDELIAEQNLGDKSWNALKQYFSIEQVFEFFFTKTLEIASMVHLY